LAVVKNKIKLVCEMGSAGYEKQFSTSALPHRMDKIGRQGRTERHSRELKSPESVYREEEYPDSCAP
jgi:hypothetical protein